MSLKVKVHYQDKNDGSIKKLFFSRSVRMLKNGLPGINFKRNVYPIYLFQENTADLVFFNIDSPQEELEGWKDCPIAGAEEAIKMIESLKKTESNLDSKLWVDELEKDNKFYSKENQSLKQKIDDVTKDLMQAQESIKVLNNNIEKFKAKHYTQIDNTLKTFFGQEIAFLPRGLKALRNFESPDGVYKILQQLVKDESTVTKKKTVLTNHWHEVNKKIKTGQDVQGRIYIFKTKSESTKFVILVGHKRDQKSDIEYLRQNDPPQEWDK